MSEMIERVAKAQWELSRGHGIRCPWEEVTGEYRQAALDLARAAIEAMREPTPEMIEDQFARCYNTGEFAAAEVRRIYSAMIDVALKRHHPQ